MIEIILYLGSKKFAVIVIGKKSCGIGGVCECESLKLSAEYT